MFLRVGSDADEDEPDSLVGASPAPVLRMCGSIAPYSHSFNQPAIREKSSALREPQDVPGASGSPTCQRKGRRSRWTSSRPIVQRAVVSEECLEGSVDGFLNLSIDDERAAGLARLASPAPVLRMCGSIDAYSQRFNGPAIRDKSSALPEPQDVPGASGPPTC